MLRALLRVFLLVLCVGMGWSSQAGALTSVPAAKALANSALVNSASVNSLSADSSHVANVASVIHSDLTAVAQIPPGSVTNHVAASSSLNTSFVSAHPGETALHSSVVEAQPGQLVWHFPDCSLTSRLPSDSGENQHSVHDRQLDPAITGSSRAANLVRHDADDWEPLYQLVIEWPIEPAPSFAKNYSIDFHSVLDWTLRVIPPAGRIAGWKDSNQLYQPSHYSLSLVS